MRDISKLLDEVAEVLQARGEVELEHEVSLVNEGLAEIVTATWKLDVLHVMRPVRNMNKHFEASKKELGNIMRGKDHTYGAQVHNMLWQLANIFRALGTPNAASYADEAKKAALNLSDHDINKVDSLLLTIMTGKFHGALLDMSTDLKHKMERAKKAGDMSVDAETIKMVNKYVMHAMERIQEFAMRTTGMNSKLFKALNKAADEFAHMWPKVPKEYK